MNYINYNTMSAQAPPFPAEMCQAGAEAYPLLGILYHLKILVKQLLGD